MLAGLGVGGAFFLAFHGVTVHAGGAVAAGGPQPGRDAAADRRRAGRRGSGRRAVLLSRAHGEAWHGATFWFKNAWLSPGFFVGRTVAYVVLWLVARWLVSAQSPAGIARSALALVVLGLSVSAAGFDWIMSLEPLWFSTMFAAYQFAGVFVSSLAVPWY